MDLTAGIFWAASPPNGLGKFVAFDVNNFTNELPKLTIPADETLTDGEYERARQAQECLADGLIALKKLKAPDALQLAEKAETLNPGFYQNSFLQGRALLALGKPGEAAQAFQKALSEQPAFLKETQELEELLREAKSAN
jgi:tetratricopeptide (TPR) repeat protein